MKLTPTFETTIAGIPCGVVVNHFHTIPRWRGSIYSCPSAEDYYGGDEFDYTILDRKGYPAEWLEKKLKPTDEYRLLTEYKEYLNA